MDKDFQTTMDSDAQLDENRQNRRQFFNGLGKWSLAVIAAVTGLRDALNGMQDTIGSRFEGPSAGQNNVRRQIAKKKRPHGDQPHINETHSNNPTPHGDYYRRPKPPDGSTTSPDGTKRKFE